MSWESEVKEYVKSLQVNGRSEGYIKNSTTYLNALGEALDPESFLKIPRKDLTEWLIKVKENGISGRGPIKVASWNAVKSVIRAAFRHLNEDESPKNIKGMVVTKNPSRAALKRDLPTDEDITRLAKVMSPQKKALLLTIRHTGARPSEILRLKRGDVSEVGRRILLQIRKTKTNSPREASLVDGKAKAALKDWIAQAPEGKYLFTSRWKPGQPIGYQSFWLAMQTAAKKAGVPKKKAVPYLLRHAFLTDMATGKNPMNTVLLTAQVGLKSDTMLRNYTKADSDDIGAAMEAREEVEEESPTEELKGILRSLMDFVERNPEMGYRFVPVDVIGEEEEVVDEVTVAIPIPPDRMMSKSELQDTSK
jgi:integrase